MPDVNHADEVHEPEHAPEGVHTAGESRYPPAAFDGDHHHQRRGRRRRGTPIRVVTPLVAPMQDGDEQQAVTALATMIAAWWQHQHTERPERGQSPAD